MTAQGQPFGQAGIELTLTAYAGGTLIRITRSGRGPGRLDPQPAQRNSRCPTKPDLWVGWRQSPRSPQAPHDEPDPDEYGLFCRWRKNWATFYIRTPVQVPAGTVTASATPSKPLAA